LHPLSDHLESWFPDRMYQGFCSESSSSLASSISLSDPNSVISPARITKSMLSRELMSRMMVNNPSLLAEELLLMCVSATRAKQVPLSVRHPHIRQQAARTLNIQIFIYLIIFRFLGSYRNPQDKPGTCMECPRWSSVRSRRSGCWNTLCGYRLLPVVV